MEIFIAYSREDQGHLERLRSHLTVLERTGKVGKIWFDGEIEGGQVWEREISDALKRANIILLLISPDFISSDYCYEREMKLALEYHKQGKAKVIPLLIRQCSWEQINDLFSLQAFPQNGKFVQSNDWRDADEAYDSITKSILSIIETEGEKKAFCQFWEKADYLISQKQWRDAVVQLEKAKSLHQETFDFSLDEIEHLIERCKREMQFKILIEQGKKSFESKNYEEALDIFLKAEQLFLDRAARNWIERCKREMQFKVLMNQGKQHFKANDYEKAIEIFLQAQHLFPDRSAKEWIERSNREIQFNVLIDEGKQQFQAKEFSKALGTFQKAEQLFENRSVKDWIEKCQLEMQFKVLINQGKRQFETKEYEKAVETFKKAEALFKDRSTKDWATRCKRELEFDDLMKQGITLFDKKDYRKAVDVFHKAEQFFPNRSAKEWVERSHQEIKYGSFIKQGKQFFHNKDFDKALVVFRKAVQIFDDRSAQEWIEHCNQEIQYKTLIGQGKHHFYAKKYKKALEQFHKAEGLFEDRSSQEWIDRCNQEIQFNIFIEQGKHLFFNENFEHAIQAFQKALQLFPDRSVGYWIERSNQEMQYKTLINEGKRYFENKDFEKALEAFLRADKLFEDRSVEDWIEHCQEQIKNPKAKEGQVFDYLEGDKENYFQIDAEQLWEDTIVTKIYLKDEGFCKTLNHYIFNEVAIHQFRLKRYHHPVFGGFLLGNLIEIQNSEKEKINYQLAFQRFVSVDAKNKSDYGFQLDVTAWNKLSRNLEKYPNYRLLGWLHIYPTYHINRGMVSPSSFFQFFPERFQILMSINLKPDLKRQANYSTAIYTRKPNGQLNNGLPKSGSWLDWVNVKDWVDSMNVV